MVDVEFRGAYPIGETAVQALPVKEIGPAVGYYTQVLGFTLVGKTQKAATLRRGDAEIGLSVNGADPEQASVYFEVSDPDALRAALENKGIEPSALRLDQYGENQYRVFFAKEPYGVCFCFGKKQG